jgi:hypothetical protein
MHNDAGNLSVDFLAGFTIFILAFIWVATMIPTLLIGLNAHSIDYNAVAYRTSVILVEDPGAAGSVSGALCSGYSVDTEIPWESQKSKCGIARFGLAVSRDTPNVLDENKINRFFSGNASIDPTADDYNLSYPDDYLKRAIFGNYPYRFNISLKIDGEDKTRHIGDTIPEQDYGYIRRAVLVKSNSSATIDESLIKARYWSNNTTMQGNFTEDTFSIHFNGTKLLKGIMASPHEVDYRGYQINPGLDTIVINITGLNTLYYDHYSSSTTTNLSEINLHSSSANLGGPFTNKNTFTYIDGNTTPVGTLPAKVNNSISLVIPPGAVISDTTMSIDPDVYLDLVFENRNPLPTVNDTTCDITHPCGNWYINSSASGPFEYDYNTTNVTQPQLRPGILEVAVW